MDITTFTPEQLQLFELIKNGHDKIVHDEVSDEKLIVWNAEGKQEHFIEISKDELYEFARKSGGADYVKDFHDPGDYHGHGQKSGTISQEDYFIGILDECISEDICEFIKSL